MRFKVEVQADSSGSWTGNQMRFETAAEAAQYAKDLALRWTAVRAWRVFDIEEAVVVTEGK